MEIMFIIIIIVIRRKQKQKEHKEVIRKERAKSCMINNGPSWEGFNTTYLLNFTQSQTSSVPCLSVESCKSFMQYSALCYTLPCGMYVHFPVSKLFIIIFELFKGLSDAHSLIKTCVEVSRAECQSRRQENCLEPVLPINLSAPKCSSCHNLPSFWVICFHPSHHYFLSLSPYKPLQSA